MKYLLQNYENFPRFEFNYIFDQRLKLEYSLITNDLKKVFFRQTILRLQGNDFFFLIT